MPIGVSLIVQFHTICKISGMEETTTRLPRGRAQLVRVLSSAGDVIHVDDVVTALQLDRTGAAQRLSRWVEQGWLRRVGRGAETGSSTHGELSHHAAILMLQNVAVIHVGILLGRGMIETHDNFRPVVVIHHYHVFPALLIR